MYYRMIGAALIALALALLLGPGLIRYLKKLHFGQTIYELGPSHQQKQGTPVMGGLMMAAGILAASLICHPIPWAGAWDFIIPLLGVSFLSMAVGFADDYIKAVKKRHDGLNPMQKIAGQVVVSLGFSVYCYFSPKVGSSIQIPFTGLEWDLGIFYIPVMTLLVIFIVNSSNLQDGLDGLLSTVTTVSSASWAVICLILLVSARAADSTDTATVAVFAMSMVGACIGFLRFNRYPAKTFMGDTGSMLLGGGTVAMALLLRQPLLLLLSFFTPIMSSVSVIIQRYYFKLTHGKRIFLMSPIHHHFEKKGYSETQIVSMYAGITMILSLIAIVSVCAMQ
jgi:phospho-N-acetylmuramoyl-pentapeptide-transferase